MNTFPDTLRILQLSDAPTISPEALALFGVVLGGLIALAGNWVMAKRQAKIEIQKAFFTRRLDTYLKLAEMSWQGYSVSVKSEQGESQGAYPQAYETFPRLKEWLNQMVAIVDQNRLLLDQASYKNFERLNHKILSDLDKARSDLSTDDLDKSCRDTGRNSVADIQGLTEHFVASLRDFLKSTYGIKLEKVL